MSSSFSLCRLCLSVLRVIQMGLVVNIYLLTLNFIMFSRGKLFLLFYQNQQHQIVMLILYALVLTLLSCWLCTQLTDWKQEETLLANRSWTSQRKRKLSWDENLAFSFLSTFKYLSWFSLWTSGFTEKYLPVYSGSWRSRNISLFQFYPDTCLVVVFCVTPQERSGS